MSAYVNYYSRAIATHPIGLKLVLGGTGLGKTSSLAALLAKAKTDLSLAGVKFIYVANRIQLLDEMGEQVAGLQLHVQQKRDTEQLRDVLASGALTDLLTHPALPMLAQDYNRLNPAIEIRLDALRTRISRLQGLQRLEQLDAIAMAGVVDTAALAREILRPLKGLLALARKFSTATHIKEQLTKQTTAKELAGLSIWWQLFPYIRFQEDDSCRLLLITLHKAFYGVFDGRRAQRLGRWALPATGRYVFVFDEFDFLEHDLLQLLTNSQEVADPFGLVQTFYERMKHRKLAHRGYLAEAQWQSIRTELDEICTRIDALKNDYGIDFPAITQFITQDKKLRHKAIFQSNYSLVKRDVYLQPASQRPNSFELTAKRPTGDAPGQHALLLLDIVNRAVQDIIRLFTRLEADHEDIYQELLRQAFGSSNYAAEIRRTKQIGGRHEHYETNYGNLLANGFGLYELEGERSRLTDPEEVLILYRSLNRSPESIMREMGEQFLVFGLSATAHIRRVLNYFDWAGLAHPADPHTSFGPLENTTDDQQDIALANAAKATARGNKLRPHTADPVVLTTPLGRQLAAMARRSDYFEEKTPEGHRFRRVRHFFGILARLAAQQAAGKLDDDQMHLVFLSSVRQVADILQSGGDEDSWFGAIPQPGMLDKLRVYEVWYRDAAANGERLTCSVVLYDARLGQDLRQDPAAQQQYNALFWQGRPVLVLTTYPSAGNGVNLQYYRTPEDYAAALAGQAAIKYDFRFLHLLDAPYFYFEGTRTLQQEAPEKVAGAIKRDVYGIIKLLCAKVISEGRAAGYLGQVRQLSTFNSVYLGLPDGILNQFSVFVQALGRIERVWQPMPTQEVWLDEHVERVFTTIATNPDFANDYQNYLRYASTNMRELLAALAHKTMQLREDLPDEVLELRVLDEQATAAINELLTDIEAFKQTGQPADTRKRWQKLRREVLKHNMQGEELQRIGGTFRTEYARDGVLYRNGLNQLAPPGTRDPEFTPWALNAVYRPLTQFLDSALANRFRRRGYELGFIDSGTYFLPNVYQSILAGAIGEEILEGVFELCGLRAQGDYLPDQLFEVADLQVQHRPVYIDCKYFGKRTLRHFALTAEDYYYHPKLNEGHFRKRMVAKWQTLHAAQSPLSQRLSHAG